MDPQFKRNRSESQKLQQSPLQQPLQAVQLLPEIRPWSSSEIAVLVDLVDRELPLSDVALGLGRTTAECKAELNRHRAAQRSNPTPALLRPSITSLAAQRRDAANASPQPNPSPSDRQSSVAPSVSSSSHAPSKPWTLADDLTLADAVATHGTRWQVIRDTTFPNRSVATITRRWSIIEGLMVTATASAQAALDPAPQLQVVLGAWHDSAKTAVENRKVNAALRRRLATSFFSGSDTVGSRSPESFGDRSDRASSSSSISLSGLRIGSSGSDRSSVQPSPMRQDNSTFPSNHVRLAPALNVATSAPALPPQLLQQPPHHAADFDGDRLVEVVQQFVERHAVAVDSPPPAAIDEDVVRDAALNSVDNVLQHLDLYRPREQIGRVAQEMTICSMGKRRSMPNSKPTLPEHVTMMQCGATDAVDDQAESILPSADSSDFTRRHRVRPPGAEEVQAMVSMHIHKALEEQAIPTNMPYVPFPHSHAHHHQLGRGDAAQQDDERNYAATAARASTAAFFASWANLETAGALHSPAWNNVFEPQRCLLRAGMPRLMAFLPCLYVSLSGTTSASSPTSGTARDFASRMCPFNASSTFREWVFGAEATMAEHAAATPW